MAACADEWEAFAFCQPFCQPWASDKEDVEPSFSQTFRQPFNHSTMRLSVTQQRKAFLLINFRWLREQLKSCWLKRANGTFIKGVIRIQRRAIFVQLIIQMKRLSSPSHSVCVNGRESIFQKDAAANCLHHSWLVRPFSPISECTQPAEPFSTRFAFCLDSVWMEKSRNFSSPKPFR